MNTLQNLIDKLKFLYYDWFKKSTEEPAFNMSLQTTPMEKSDVW